MNRTFTFMPLMGCMGCHPYKPSYNDRNGLLHVLKNTDLKIKKKNLCLCCSLYISQMGGIPMTCSSTMRRNMESYLHMTAAYLHIRKLLRVFHSCFSLCDSCSVFTLKGTCHVSKTQDWDNKSVCLISVDSNLCFVILFNLVLLWCQGTSESFEI